MGGGGKKRQYIPAPDGGYTRVGTAAVGYPGTQPRVNALSNTPLHPSVNILRTSGTYKYPCAGYAITGVVSRRCRILDLLCFHTHSKDRCLFFGRARLARGGLIWLASLARLTLVGKSVGHELASPANLPTTFKWMVNGTFYRLVINSEIAPIHRSTRYEI